MRLGFRQRRHALEEAERLAAAVGLEHVRDAVPSALSGGMQQRLAIAQVLILKPGIMLLDEPLGALDPGIRADMQVLMTALWQETGMTVFMATHNLREAFTLGSRVLTFDKRRHDPQAPEAYGATITYDLRGRSLTSDVPDQPAQETSDEAPPLLDLDPARPFSP